MRAKGQGRKPVPTALKLIRGSAQPCRINPDEPKPEADKIGPPPELSEKALEHWEDLSAQLEEVGVLTNMDVKALGVLCETYAQWVEANSRLSVGLVIKNDKGHPVPNPYFNISDKLAKRVQQMLSEFGMTPSARTRVVSNKPDDGSNSFDQF